MLSNHARSTSFRLELTQLATLCGMIATVLLLDFEVNVPDRRLILSTVQHNKTNEIQSCTHAHVRTYTRSFSSHSRISEVTTQGENIFTNGGFSSHLLYLIEFA